MANTILTPRILASNVLAHLENDLVIANNVNVDYSKEFSNVGATIDVERPQRYVGQSDNLDISSYNEDLVGGKFPLTLNKTETIAFEIEAKDMTLSVESAKIQQKYVAPAVIKLKDRVEQELGNLYYKFWNFSGTPGTTPSTFLALAAPGTVLTNGGIPKSGRMAFHNPDTSLTLADSLKGVFVQGKARTALEEASMGRYGGFDNFETVHLPTHTVGDHGGTPLVAGAAQNVTYATAKDTNSQTLNTDGWPLSKTGLLKKGDVFTIAGVFAVNPVTRVSTGRLQDFVVNADADSDGAGLSTINISPAIISSGAFQTVSAAPADNAAITVKTGAANTSYTQSLLMNKDALTLVTRPLQIDGGGAFRTHSVAGNRMSLSISETGDFNTLKRKWRIDMLFDMDSMNRDYAVRLTG